MIELKQGDCLELIKQIADSSIDLVVTDPPYRCISGGNKSTKWISGYGSSVLHKNDGKIFDNNGISFESWLPEVYRVLKDGSHFYCMTNVLNLEKLLTASRQVGFYLHNVLVWEKNTANANRWYMKNCEFTLFFKKGRAKTINDPSSKMVHQFKNPVGNKLHPTEKPVELMEFYVKNSSNEGDLVLDPFFGSGSTAVACANTNRNFIGFELDEKYFEIAKNRINGEQLQKTQQLKKGV